MKTRLSLILVLFSLVSCGKEGSLAPQKKYPTVPEAALQGVARTNLDSPSPTTRQLARKQKNTNAVKAMGLPTLESLPVIEDETAIQPRSAQEIADRCLSIEVCAVKGETNDQEFIAELVERFEVESHLSPEELAFIQDKNATPQDLANFAWRYECVHVLLWSLGYLESLQSPVDICDVSGEARIIREQGKDGLGTNAKSRPMVEILDAADLYYRLHWAAIELRIHNKTSSAVNEEIVMERHRALNWLIRYLNQEWDDVTTDT